MFLMSVYIFIAKSVYVFNYKRHSASNSMTLRIRTSNPRDILSVTWSLRTNENSALKHSVRQLGSTRSKLRPSSQAIRSSQNGKNPCVLFNDNLNIAHKLSSFGTVFISSVRQAVSSVASTEHSDPTAQ
jgi:hypothetical protein